MAFPPVFQIHPEYDVKTSESNKTIGIPVEYVSLLPPTKYAIRNQVRVRLWVVKTGLFEFDSEMVDGALTSNQTYRLAYLDIHRLISHSSKLNYILFGGVIGLPNPHFVLFDLFI